MAEEEWKQDHWKRGVEVLGGLGSSKGSSKRVLKILRIKIEIGLERVSMSQG